MLLDFPTDEYTPHGYLASPYAIARSWTEGFGGNLRTTREGLGFGWLYPWARDAVAGAQLEVGVGYREGDAGRVAPDIPRPLTRAELARFGSLHATHHSALLFEYGWELFELSCRARFVLADRDELGLEIEIAPVDQGDRRPAQDLTLYICAAGWRRDGGVMATTRDQGGRVDLGDRFGPHELLVDAPVAMRSLGVAASLQTLAGGARRRRSARGDRVAVGVAVPLQVTRGQEQRVTAILRRAGGGGRRGQHRNVGHRVRDAIASARRSDAEYWRRAGRVVGDWPASWRRGWVYDLETTRMCVFPPGGLFTDVWPSWMIQWPRAVVAEGTLDMARLAYADPDLAKRAVLSLFRDAPAANVPCIFQHGEPNMVARDGSLCGTSPAWCVPFYNLERLYLHTLDHAWLATLYPYLAAYLDWWLRERTDAEGWAVYKCTWEAGEDDTPRLDPERRGDNVVSGFVRPVELQATMALSAAVLGRFAGELGLPSEAERWRVVARSFAGRTRQLWDPAVGRFRDWDRRAGGFLEPSGVPNYWGIDPCRYSALAFTPLLAGLADEDQTRALAREFDHYAGPPWTLWPSWSYVLAEAALAAGQREFAGQLAADIVARVYAELDRRDVDPDGGPTPGVAREYWPLDLASWSACEGYGWGATTATLLVRHVFGFLEGDYRPGIRFRVWPWLPPSLLVVGRRYELANVPYRGASLNLAYTVTGATEPRLEVKVSMAEPSVCLVVDGLGRVAHESRAPGVSHRFAAQVGRLHYVELQSAPGSL